MDAESSTSATHPHLSLAGRKEARRDRLMTTGVAEGHSAIGKAQQSSESAFAADGAGE